MNYERKEYRHYPNSRIPKSAICNLPSEIRIPTCRQGDAGPTQPDPASGLTTQRTPLDALLTNGHPAPDSLRNGGQPSRPSARGQTADILEQLIQVLPKAKLEEGLPAGAPLADDLDSPVGFADALLRRLKQKLAKSKELTEQQHKAIELLLSGQRPAEVAQQLGIHPGTLWRWRQRDEDFRATLVHARESAFRNATDRLRELVPRSLDILEDQLAEGNHQAAARILRLARIDRGPSVQQLA